MEENGFGLTWREQWLTTNSSGPPLRVEDESTNVQHGLTRCGPSSVGRRYDYGCHKYGKQFPWIISARHAVRPYLKAPSWWQTTVPSKLVLWSYTNSPRLLRAMIIICCEIQRVKPSLCTQTMIICRELQAVDPRLWTQARSEHHLFTAANMSTF